MSIFYAETGIGCCIREALTIDAARAQILAEVGIYNGIQLLRIATDDDVNYVFRKGGQIPNSLLYKLRADKAYSDSLAICSPAIISGLR